VEVGIYLLKCILFIVYSRGCSATQVMVTQEVDSRSRYLKLGSSQSALGVDSDIPDVKHGLPLQVFK
jgi:hypothetical protein